MSKFFKVYSGPGYPVDPELEKQRQWEAWVQSQPKPSPKTVELFNAVCYPNSTKVPRIYQDWLKAILHHRN